MNFDWVSGKFFQKLLKLPFFISWIFDLIFMALKPVGFFESVKNKSFFGLAKKILVVFFLLSVVSVVSFSLRFGDKWGSILSQLISGGLFSITLPFLINLIVASFVIKLFLFVLRLQGNLKQVLISVFYPFSLSLTGYLFFINFLNFVIFFVNFPDIFYYLIELVFSLVFIYYFAKAWVVYSDFFADKKALVLGFFVGLTWFSFGVFALVFTKFYHFETIFILIFSFPVFAGFVSRFFTQNSKSISFASIIYSMFLIIGSGFSILQSNPGIIFNNSGFDVLFALFFGSLVIFLSEFLLLFVFSLILSIAFFVVGLIVFRIVGFVFDFFGFGKGSKKFSEKIGSLKKNVEHVPAKNNGFFGLMRLFLFSTKNFCKFIKKDSFVESFSFWIVPSSIIFIFTAAVMQYNFSFFSGFLLNGVFEFVFSPVFLFFVFFSAFWLNVIFISFSLILISTIFKPKASFGSVFSAFIYSFGFASVISLLLQTLQLVLFSFFGIIGLLAAIILSFIVGLYLFYIFLIVLSSMLEISMLKALAFYILALVLAYVGVVVLSLIIVFFVLGGFWFG